ncbi:cell envelope integrity EipB family protein [Aquamicrobium ahrensii]|uniref:ATP-binding protein n=1 Tax=Aquamicrobium ahrensii TaxID=469551 RepID=A0ABV2KGW9_9HYPH
MRASRLAYTAILLPIIFSTVPAVAAPVLQPHRAVYDISLNKASDRSGITGISGRMVYEFNGSQCDGYTVKFRLVTRISTTDAMRMTDQQTTTFEDGEGKTFSFVTKSFVDQNLEREVKGTAHREKDSVRVDIDKPEPNNVTLPPTQFPTQHMFELIDKAGKGENFYETSLFDGSEDADRVMLTTVVIGKPAPADRNDPELPLLSTLEKDQFWPVDIAYFNSDESDGGEELPEYRISFKMHRNGLTRDLQMDYGDFTMTGKLVDLSLFDQVQKDCKE